MLEVLAEFTIIILIAAACMALVIAPISVIAYVIDKIQNGNT